MKIAIVINGTRGDVQPMLALSSELVKKGHQVIFCAPPENEQLAKNFACQFVAFGPDYKALFQKNAQMKGGATASPSPDEMKKETANQIDRLPELLLGANLILGVGFVLGVHTVADILKVPYRFVIFYPVLLGTSSTDPFINRWLFGFGKSMTNLVMKNFINKKRAEHKLPPIKDVWANWMGDHVIVACDKELNEARTGVFYKFTQTGFLFTPSENALPAHVEAFLKSGKPPVFIGFGSNPVAKPEKFMPMFEEVAEATKQRLIVSKGWADLPENNTPDILYEDDLPFEMLFPGIAAIVYHGGTGTMALAARAGIPQIAFPFMADQFENRKQIVKLQLGPKACDFKKISSSGLVSAINNCLSNDQFRLNAVELAKKLQDTDGLKMTVELIENELIS